MSHSPKRLGLVLHLAKSSVALRSSAAELIRGIKSAAAQEMNLNVSQSDRLDISLSEILNEHFKKDLLPTEVFRTGSGPSESLKEVFIYSSDCVEEECQHLLEFL